ncbi:hypothetical protein PI95_003805 [Hassallia byssoidea VB512170]|uniref:Uncharacterized protein n=1 Tax=Hassallia byssoidea VB512170 TaxID=1304833 RepID=A0A846H2S9_9CYAN|nr:hypothetical protein [Hassalia byssoidea]NEU71732.1 hypothetical protein [Hassalia byssoidea VB512170]
MYYKRMAYCQLEDKFVTYIFPVSGGHIRYKILNPSEIKTAIFQCNKAGWKVINATNLVNKMLEPVPFKSRS